ncbi:MAG: hypothetical protein K1W22_14565 [Lachnospiraceae bacterium]|jgi:hypothetical protein
MEVMMQEQDKRAVESMCRCGLNLEGVINVFPNLPREEIVAIYKFVRNRDIDADGESSVSINCS